MLAALKVAITFSDNTHLCLVSENKHLRLFARRWLLLGLTRTLTTTTTVTPITTTVTPNTTIAAPTAIPSTSIAAATVIAAAAACCLRK
jgi:hypothetical protein